MLLFGMFGRNLMPEGISLVVLPQRVWENIATTLSRVENLLQKKNEEEVSNQWIESAQVRKMLGISAKTWQTYRDERRIPFSQFGRKIYVKQSDLESFMQEHYINACNKEGGAL